MINDHPSSTCSLDDEPAESAAAAIFPAAKNFSVREGNASAAVVVASWQPLEPSASRVLLYYIIEHRLQVPPGAPVRRERTRLRGQHSSSLHLRAHE